MRIKLEATSSFVESNISSRSPLKALILGPGVAQHFSFLGFWPRIDISTGQPVRAPRHGDGVTGMGAAQLLWVPGAGEPWAHFSSVTFFRRPQKKTKTKQIFEPQQPPLPISGQAAHPALP